MGIGLKDVYVQTRFVLRQTHSTKTRIRKILKFILIAQFSKLLHVSYGAGPAPAIGASLGLGGFLLTDVCRDQRDSSLAFCPPR